MSSPPAFTSRPVVQDDGPRGLRPMMHRGARPPVDWADAVPLSSLQRREPTVEYGWVSIELVSHLGVPFAGTEVTLVHCDARRDRVVLDATGRHAARAVAPKWTIVPRSDFDLETCMA